MKPFRIFIFYAAVLLLLFLIALLMPRQGIGITDNLRLQFVSLPDLFAEDTLNKDHRVKELLAASTVTDDPELNRITPSEPVDTSHLGSGNGYNNDPGTGSDTPSGSGPETPSGPGAGTGTATGSEPVGNTGSIESNPAEKNPPVDPANRDSLRRSVFPIRFSEADPDLLEGFFRSLEGLVNGEVSRARILHFGDSQIENDRMTALIRFRLQERFGGSGTGLVPAIPIYAGHMAFKQSQEGEWLRYTYFGKRDTSITHNSYGIMGAFASVPGPEGENWPSLNFRFNTRRRTGRLDRVRIFLHSYIDDAAMTIQVNDTITDTIRHISDGYSVADYRHHGFIRDLGIRMNLPEGGRIYGISFESYRGLQMDNIAMRGGSGLIFTKMDHKNQRVMLDHLSPDLIILQYGGNVVPYITPRYYEKAFKRELNFLKELCPDVPVIIIGPADMSTREKGRFISYPNLEPVRDALRNAALDSGFAFWDLYEAMGGYNSMPSFVHADPPLARPDYVHFTSLGVNLVAEMFYNALMLEYIEFLSKTSDP